MEFPYVRKIRLRKKARQAIFIAKSEIKLLAQNKRSGHFPEFLPQDNFLFYGRIEEIYLARVSLLYI